MEGTVKGLTIVVTGASGAVGSAAVKAIQAQGGRAIRIARQVGEGPEDSPGFDLDLTDRAAVEAVVPRLGGFDAVFNIAGGFAMGAKVHEADDPMEKMMAINLHTARNMMAAAIPVLSDRGGGAIVSVGAYAALKGGAPTMGAYVASKAAVHSLTQTAAEEQRGAMIRVNAVCPTVIDTQANREAMPKADPAEWVSPDRLAAIMCFLASPAAQDVTGALLPVRARS